MLAGITGVWLHWFEERSVPCHGNTCEHCQRGVGAFWRAYFPALRNIELRGKEWQDLIARTPVGAKIPPPPIRTTRIIAEIGEEAAAPLEGRNCAGLVVLISKANIVRAPVRLEITEKRLAQPPPPHDVRAALCRLWRVNLQAHAAPDQLPRIATFDPQKRKQA